MEKISQKLGQDVIVCPNGETIGRKGGVELAASCNFPVISLFDLGGGRGGGGIAKGFKL